MSIIANHIKKYIEAFIKSSVIDVKVVYPEIVFQKKTKYWNLLLYFERIIKEYFNMDSNGLNCLHLHFENDFTEEEKTLLFEYLIIKTFLLNNEKNNESSSDLDDLINDLIYHQNRLERNCPSDASAKNGGNRIWKNWKKEKSQNKALLDFYQKMNNGNSFSPKSIFNVQKNFGNTILEIFNCRPFCINLDSDLKSFNIINTSNSLNEIDNIDSEIINELNFVVLFDCDRKSLMFNFSFEEINKWNTDYSTEFTKYLIVTFGTDYPHVKNTMKRLELIKERFKIPNHTSYTITHPEVNFLLQRNDKSLISIEFIGFETSSYWDAFVLETSIRELYELRSIKLMNVYSVCYTAEIKKYIINDIFSSKDSSELISTATKMSILELSDDDIELLKEALSNILDVLISTGTVYKVSDLLSNNPTILLDEGILRNQNLFSKIRNCLCLTNTIKFRPWSDLINLDCKNLLILSYRDQGRYPNYYFPSLLEPNLDYNTRAIALLPSFLFSHIYNWSKYNLYNDYFKFLSHPIRERHYEWNDLKNKLQELKPEQRLNIDWNLENDYSNSDQRESYKIKLKGQRAKTAYGSDLFIISEDSKTGYKVIKIDYLLSIDNEDKMIFIQNLEEIQQNINIYEKIVDQKQQEAELEIIRKQFDLGDETAGRLWKVLLKKIAEERGEQTLYSDLKKYFESKGIKIVSEFHFKNSWLNPNSESIAPLSKRVFIELCEYLKIPKIYFIIIQRIRNASKKSSRQSTRQMNQLLKDIFNDGCFDTDKNPNEILNNRLEYYKAKHPLDELGIDENYLAANLLALVELIQQELKLVELETIEKIKND